MVVGRRGPSNSVAYGISPHSGHTPFGARPFRSYPQLVQLDEWENCHGRPSFGTRASFAHIAANEKTPITLIAHHWKTTIRELNQAVPIGAFKISIKLPNDSITVTAVAPSMQ